VSTFELDIVAVDRATLDSVKGQLLKKIDEMVGKPVEITDQFIAEISNNCKREILSLESTADVKIIIGV